MKYKKKPEVIEALQFTNNPNNLNEIQEFVGEGELHIIFGDFPDYSFIVVTPETQVSFKPGDYISKNEQGVLSKWYKEDFERNFEVSESVELTVEEEENIFNGLLEYIGREHEHLSFEDVRAITHTFLDLFIEAQERME